MSPSKVESVSERNVPYMNVKDREMKRSFRHLVVSGTDLHVHDVLHQCAVLALDQCLEGLDSLAQEPVLFGQLLPLLFDLLDVRGGRREHDGLGRLRRWQWKVLDISIIIAVAGAWLLEAGNHPAECFKLGVDRLAIFAFDLMMGHPLGLSVVSRSGCFGNGW